MARVAIGERVGAILKADDETVHLFGFGIYKGEEVPPADSGGVGALLHRMQRENPVIELDNGKKVYGCECWWGPEGRVREIIGNRRVIEVDIDEARKGAAAV